MLVFETEEDKRLVLKLEFICEENKTEAQGEHKEEQTACHKPAVGTGVSQPHRWHPSSAHGGGFGSLRQDFGLWEGPAVLRIHQSGDSRGKELNLTAESGGQLGDNDLPRNSVPFLLAVSALNQPWTGYYCRWQPSLGPTRVISLFQTQGCCWRIFLLSLWDNATVICTGWKYWASWMKILSAGCR